LERERKMYPPKVKRLLGYDKRLRKAKTIQLDGISTIIKKEYYPKWQVCVSLWSKLALDAPCDSIIHFRVHHQPELYDCFGMHKEYGPIYLGTHKAGKCKYSIYGLGDIKE
jgi:hypothetical protein